MYYSISSILRFLNNTSTSIYALSSLKYSDTANSTVFVDCGLWDQLKGGTPGDGAINRSGKKAGSKTSNMTQVQPVNETVGTGSANGENGGGFKTWGT